jgi:hypothetical protein
MIRLLLGLFTGGSSIPWIIGGVVAAGITFFGWLAYHDHEVWNKATEDFNAKQDAIVQQQKEEFQKKTTEIEDNAARIRAIIAESQKDNHETLSGIMKNAEGKPSVPASPYLKSIVKQLNEAYGEKK